MPLSFNTAQDATLGQLANYYTGNPNISPTDVQTNTSLDSAQAADWLIQQGNKLGIGDPSDYFQKAVNAQKLANTPSGAQMEATRQMGQFAPGSLPDQLQKRDAMQDMVSNYKQQQATQLASLQNQNALTANPLIPGQPAQLTPLQQQDATSKGQSPSEYLLQNRLGTNTAMPITGQSTLTAMGIQPGQQMALPQDLYQHPAFQRMLQQKPDQASQVFSALSGASLPQFQQNWQASQMKQKTDQIADLQKGLQSGDAIPDPNNPGKQLWRQTIADPTHIGGPPLLTNTYGPGSAYQQSLSQHLPEVSKMMGDFATLQQKKNVEGITAAQSIALAQARRGAPNSQGNQTPEPVSQPGTFFNTFAAAGANGTNWETDPNGFIPPAGTAPTHAAPILRNNSKFQELLRTNPAAAHRMIMAIQQKGSQDTTPQAATQPIAPIPGAGAY